MSVMTRYLHKDHQDNPGTSALRHTARAPAAHPFGRRTASRGDTTTCPEQPDRLIADARSSVGGLSTRGLACPGPLRWRLAAAPARGMACIPAAALGRADRGTRARMGTCIEELLFSEGVDAKVKNDPILQGTAGAGARL